MAETPLICARCGERVEGPSGYIRRPDGGVGHARCPEAAPGVPVRDDAGRREDRCPVCAASLAPGENVLFRLLGGERTAVHVRCMEPELVCPICEQPITKGADRGWVRVQGRATHLRCALGTGSGPTARPDAEPPAE